MIAENAYAKLNLALHVRRRRADGYHDIETVFAFCENGDALSGEVAEGLSLEVTGPFGEALADERDNLVLAAARALKEAAGVDDGARLVLCKRLPVAAGLGGGSADAAAALRLLDRLWGTGLDIAELERIASRLGADVPACVRGVAVRGEGRGDALTSVDAGLAGMPVLLVNPGVAVSTPRVFARWDGIDRGALGDWRDGRNDLTASAIALAPVIAPLLALLDAQAGVTLARMSGSGATCFALFENERARDDATEATCTRFPAYWTLRTALR